MYDYDGVLKALFRSPSNSIPLHFAHSKARSWLSGQLTTARKLEADLVCELANGELLHIELQSRNDPSMPLRMAEYSLTIYKAYKRFPLQIVFYAGRAKLNMPDRLSGPHHHCQFAIVDMRQMDGHPWLESRHLSDNVLSILMKLEDKRSAIRRILRKISDADRPTKEAALSQLLILSELRSLAPTVSEEASLMPITEDIMDHQIIGPAIRKGLAQGRREGLRQGLEEGLQKGMEQGIEKGMEQGIEKGERRGRETILFRLIERRFGPIPAKARAALAQSSNDELELLSDRILEAPNLEDLLRLAKRPTTAASAKRKPVRSH